MNFFGIGFEELFVILVIIVVIFGPDRLPQFAAQVGRWVRQFRTWSADMSAEFRDISQELSAEFEDLRAITRDLQADLRGVQQDLANEMRQVSDAIHGQDGVGSIGAPALTGSDGTSSTWSGASGVPSATTGQTNGSGEATTVTALPEAATKTDPRSDVSVFDLDEVVIMTRTPRTVPVPMAVAPAELADVLIAQNGDAPRVRRRAERPQYRRPLRAATARAH